MIKALFERVSVREFTSDRVEGEKIELILKAAMAAASAGNQQPWEFIVIRNRKILEELSKVHRYAQAIKNSNCTILACFKENGLKYPEYVQIDMAIACDNILLQAQDCGLGAVWIGIAPELESMEYVEKIVGLKDMRAFALIPIGTPKKIKQATNRFDSKRIHYLD